jgi:uncharacterized protein (DUF58 family)
VESHIDINRLQEFTSLEFLARQVVEGFITGMHKSPFHGFSVEFAEHRLYNSGESTRHIDWKLYGRTEKLFIKRYEEETNLRCQIVIDNSSSMYYPVKDKPGTDGHNKLSFSVYAAAAITEMLRRQRDAVGLSLFSDTTELHTRSRSSSVHHKYLFAELEKLLRHYDSSKPRPTFAADSLHFIAENIHKRSLVVLFSDMFESRAGSEDLFLALQHLRHNKHEVVLFHVVDHAAEIDFAFDNRPYRFVDMESGEQLKIYPGEVREHYTSAIGSFYNELKLRCAQYRIDFVEADINKGFRQVLLPYLHKRQKLV